MGNPKQKVSEEVTLNKYVRQRNSCGVIGFHACKKYVFSLVMMATCLPWSGLFQLSLFLTYRLFSTSNRKELKKVTKLEAQIPYHEGRGNKEEVEKIKEQIAAVWERAKEAMAE